MRRDAAGWPHVVALVDMDAFYVSVELLRRPELRGLPVIVAGSGPRAVVTTASYEARGFGVGSAMPAARARRLCPHGIYLRPDFAHYRSVSAGVMAIVRRHCQTIETVGLDEAYLDLSGLPEPVSSMRRLVAEIAGEVGLTASVGIGPNKLVAKVASDAEKPGGFVVLSREQACRRFERSPCRLIPGIGAKTAQRLASVGVTTIGELADASSGQLRSVFAPATAASLRSLARFEYDRPVTQQRKVISESREQTFDVDVSDRAVLERVLHEQVDQLCRTLERQGRRGRTVAIKVRLDDFSTHTRAKTLPRAVSSAAEVAPVAAALLEAFQPPRPVRLLGVRVAGLIAVEADAARDQLALAL